jgi:hypothetical protein
MAGSLLILALVPAASALADDSPNIDPFAYPLPGGFAKSPLNPHTCNVRDDIPKGAAVVERQPGILVGESTAHSATPPVSVLCKSTFVQTG